MYVVSRKYILDVQLPLDNEPSSIYIISKICFQQTISMA